MGLYFQDSLLVILNFARYESANSFIFTAVMVKATTMSLKPTMEPLLGT